MTDWSTVDRPGEQTAYDYVERGWWRTGTFLDDLAHWAGERPEHPAVVGCRFGERETVTYARLAETVERAAAMLAGLGVGAGDAVVVWVPNLWELSAIYLACARVGAAASPVLPILGEGELATALRASGATVCVTVDDYDGTPFAEQAVAAAPDTVQVVVVLHGRTSPPAATGSATESVTPEPLRDGRIRVVDFDEAMAAADLALLDERTPVGPLDPSTVLLTSGTSGTMKAVVHCPSTVYAAVRSAVVPYRLGPDDVVFLPGYQTHMAGMTYGIFTSLHVGATNVVLFDNHDPTRVLDEVAANGVTWLYAAPAFVTAAAREQREHPRDTGALVRVVTGSAPVQPALVEEVADAFGVPLHSLWGMTENGAVTMTHPDDPPDWAAHSDGRASPWMQWRIDDLPDTDGGRLLVRGANQCLGYLGQREIYDACVDEDGWFDTGDVAASDGRDGIRIVGRRTDLIMRSNGWMVSVLQVEGALHDHPAITDVALVGYPDPEVPRCELVCAVVVPEGTPPTLEEVHAHLARHGISELGWPDRVQFVWELPRNSIGKVDRRPLRERLDIEARGR